jgi:hypothetical protein
MECIRRLTCAGESGKFMSEKIVIYFLRGFFFLLNFILFSTAACLAQPLDSAVNRVMVDTVSPKATTIKKPHSPKTAAIRSALLPGLGQIYNKKYWKLPIVYGALGTTAGIFIFNLKNYKDTRFAYRVKYNMRVFHTDSTSYPKIRNDLKPLSEESLRYYRDQYRRDIDYSALFFLLCWGLNVVDATVDAHLQSFDVSPNLSLRIKPGYSEMAGTNGISLVLNFR